MSLPLSPPEPDWLADTDAECLATRLRRASDRHAARLRIHLAEAGLGFFEPGWWPLLRLIAERKELTPSSAAQALGLSPAAVSQTAGALKRAGLISEHGDEHDARMRHLRLTPAGQQLQPQLHVAAQAAHRELAAALGEDGAALRRALDALERPR